MVGLRSGLKEGLGLVLWCDASAFGLCEGEFCVYSGM